MIKKIVSMALMIAILISSVPQVNAETVNTQAQVLNRLNILRGNGVTFNLTGNLSRAEGAAFVVRMLGMEEEVLMNSEKYLTTSFTDVKPEAWYAPYVGYCVSTGILIGYNDNTFRPAYDLNEQSFLKILLVALGYEYNKDFTWADTFKKSYDAGLVSDTSYKTKTKDDKVFSRGGVVDLIYVALKMKNVMSGKIMAYSLSEKTAITTDLLVELNLITKETPKAIKNIVRSKKSDFVVEFPEAPFALKKDMITVKDQEGKVLDVLAIVPTDLNTLFEILVGDEVRNAVYTITIDKVYDKKGNPFTSYKKSFLAYDDGTYTTDLFAIKNVKQASSNSLLVTLSQPVEQSGFYADSFYISVDNNVVVDGSSDGTITAELISPDTLRLTTKGFTFEKDTIYTLHNRGTLKSDYRTHMRADSIVRFIGTTFETQAFRPTTYELVKENQIKITFNRQLNETIGNQIFSYYIEDTAKKPIKVTAAKVYNELTGSYVLLTLDTKLVDKDKLFLTINQLYTPNRDESIIETVYDVTVGTTTSLAVSLVSVVQTKAHVVKVLFNQEMDKVSASAKENYQLLKTSSATQINPVAVFYNSVEKSAYIYVSEANALTTGAEYKVTVTDKVLSAEGVAPKTSLSLSFTAKAMTTSNITISKAVYIGENMLLLKLSEPASLNVTNLLLANYQLYSYDIPVGSTIIDNSSLTLKKETLNGVIYYDPTHILLLVDSYNTLKGYRLHLGKLVEYSDWKESKDIWVTTEVAQ